MGGIMVQGQVILGGEGGDWHFSYIVFSRFIIFTLINYFTKSSSAAGCSQHQHYQQSTSADICSQHLVHAAAEDDFVICWNACVEKCLCCQANVWCVLQLMMHLLNYFTLYKIVLYIWWKIIFFCHHNFMEKSHAELSKNEPKNIP